MKQSNGPNKLHNLPSSTIINWENYKPKYYLHFDKRINIKDEKVLKDIKKFVGEPDNIITHAFLPFIHFEIVFQKYITLKSIKKDGTVIKSKKKKDKRRKIFYSSHKDSLIYKYYGDLLNSAYNQYTRKYGIDEVALAYRNNKQGKNNIDFSYEVFDFLFNQEKALVVSIDFSEFFDKISHSTLKQNLKTVLGTPELPDDWYKIYKNLTQYAYIKKDKINEFLKSKYGVKELKKIRLAKIMEANEFRAFKEKRLKKNYKSYGIPQGSGMSAVCSNVHLIHFDSEILQWAIDHKAMYRRYCDDLILVIPLNDFSIASFTAIKNELFDIIKQYESQGMKVQAEKTEIRLYQNGSIINENFEPSTLDYLGFVSDGKFMKIREKSLFKFYTRAYKKAKASKRIAFATKRPGPKKELYDIYTHLGHGYKEYGNFISYAYKAHRKMSKLKTHSLIRKQVKRHWKKIHKRLS